MRYNNRYNRLKKKDNPEGRTTMAIIHYLKGMGAIVGKTKTMGVKRGKVYCQAPYLFLGFPDLTFFYHNKLYFCEVKSPTGKQSNHQKSFQLECLKADIPYILARSLEDVQKLI